MIIKVESSCELKPTILNEFKNNSQAISDMSAQVAKNAKAIAKETFEEAIGTLEEYLKGSNITLRVAVEFGNTDDFSDNLSERMTVDERNKIRKLYADLSEGLNRCHEDCVCDALESLEELFGEEFLNDTEDD